MIWSSFLLWLLPLILHTPLGGFLSFCEGTMQKEHLEWFCTFSSPSFLFTMSAECVLFSILMPLNYFNFNCRVQWVGCSACYDECCSQGHLAEEPGIVGLPNYGDFLWLSHRGANTPFTESQLRDSSGTRGCLRPKLFCIQLVSKLKLIYSTVQKS